MFSKVKNIIIRLVYFTLPVIFLILGNMFIYFVVTSTINHREAKIFVGAVLGLVLFVALKLIVQALAKVSAITKPKKRKFSSFLIGLLIGIFISCMSAYLFASSQVKIFNWSSFKKDVMYSAVSSIAPATSEEVVFRYGIVHGVTILTNPFYGILAGSIPFGFIHFLNLFFHQNVSLQQVLSICIAGVLLSLIFIDFGLYAAIGCHFIWNTFSAPWVKAMGLDVVKEVSSFEGAPTTSLTLGIVIFCLLLIRYNRLNTIDKKNVLDPAR